MGNVKKNVVNFVLNVLFTVTWKIALSVLGGILLVLGDASPMYLVMLTQIVHTVHKIMF